MFRSTEGTTNDHGSETVSASGVATPYFMLIQMNNAALLEAYATLGIQPVAAAIEERQFPGGFNLSAALAPTARGAEDRAEHPGETLSGGDDPIEEAEGQTHGSADETRSLAQAIIGRFGDLTSDGADFGAMIENAVAMSRLPGVDFDPDILATGAAILGNSAEASSATPDSAGQAPFTGFRADYRPETAPDGAEIIKRRHLSSVIAAMLPK